MTHKPLLSSLLQNLPAAHVQGPVNVTITGVHHDSRKIEAGNVFVAISGATYEGRDFIPQDLERGAAAGVVEGELGGMRGVGDVRGGLGEQRPLDRLGGVGIVGRHAPCLVGGEQRIG